MFASRIPGWSSIGRFFARFKLSAGNPFFSFVDYFCISAFIPPIRVCCDQCHWELVSSGYFVEFVSFVIF